MLQIGTYRTSLVCVEVYDSVGFSPPAIFLTDHMLLEQIYLLFLLDFHTGHLNSGYYCLTLFVAMS